MRLLSAGLAGGTRLGAMRLRAALAAVSCASTASSSRRAVGLDEARRSGDGPAAGDRRSRSSGARLATTSPSSRGTSSYEPGRVRVSLSRRRRARGEPSRCRRLASGSRAGSRRQPFLESDGEARAHRRARAAPRRTAATSTSRTSACPKAGHVLAARRARGRRRDGAGARERRRRRRRIRRPTSVTLLPPRRPRRSRSTGGDVAKLTTRECLRTYAARVLGGDVAS